MTRTNVPSTIPLDDTQKPRKAAPKPESTKHLRPLSNGAIYDMNLKRIVSNPGGGTTAITRENASAMQARGGELKREAMMRGANRVAEQGGSVDGSEMRGDLAYVEAIGEAMTMKALSVNDPKSVDAARFVFTETGVAEKQAVEQPKAANDATGYALVRIIDYMLGKSADIIDADVTTIRNEIESNTSSE